MKIKSKYNWAEIERLAEHLSEDEIIDYLHLHPVGKEALKRIKDICREKKLKAKINARIAIRNRAVKGDMAALKSISSYSDGEQGEWLTQAQYARKFHLTRAAVTQAVNEGKLYRNEDGLVNGSTDCRSYAFSVGTGDLKEKKLKKIEVETQVLMMRLEGEREKMRLEAQIELMQELHGKYEYVRKRIQDMNLSPEQVIELDRAFADYEEGLKA